MDLIVQEYYRYIRMGIVRNVTRKLRQPCLKTIHDFDIYSVLDKKLY